MKRILTLFLSLIIVVLFSTTVFADSSLSVDGSVNDVVKNEKMVVGEYFYIRYASEYQFRLQLNGVVTFDGSRVTAIKKGTAFIQGTNNMDYHKTITYAITVDEPIVNNVILKQGEEHTLNTSNLDIWIMDNDNIISFERFETGYGIIKALNKGETYLRGTNERNSKCVYKIKVINSEDTLETPTTYTEPQETIPEFTVEYVSKDETDSGKYLPHMIIGEYLTVDNPDFYNWTIESDGAIAFDGEKITAIQKGKGKVIGIGKDDLRYTRAYDLTIGDPVIKYKTVNVGKKVYVVGTQLLAMFDNWKVENENIAVFDGHYIKGLSEGVTYLTGTNEGGGKYTFKITVVPENAPITESTNPTNSTEPTETEPGKTEPSETEPSVTDPNETEPSATEPSENQHTQDVKAVNIKPATYFRKGYTGDAVCSECGEVIKTGTSTTELKLNTPKATIKGGKKKITVKYKKVKDATGFQVKYKLGKKAVTKTYNTRKNVTKTIKNLKKGIYKVYVRAFIKQGKNKAYSTWSKAQKVKVK